MDAVIAIITKEGYAALTMEGIARHAQVGKPTLYRWWPHRAAIVAEALREQAHDVVRVPDGLSASEAIRSLIVQTTTAMAGPAGPILAALMADAQIEPGIRELVDEGFLRPRRDALTDLWQHAVDLGDVDSSGDPELWCDLVFGALWYRLLTQHAPLDEEFAHRLADAVIARPRLT